MLLSSWFEQFFFLTIYELITILFRIREFHCLFPFLIFTSFLFHFFPLLCAFVQFHPHVQYPDLWKLISVWCVYQFMVSRFWYVINENINIETVGTFIILLAWRIIGHCKQITIDTILLQVEYRCNTHQIDGDVLLMQFMDGKKHWVCLHRGVIIFFFNCLTICITASMRIERNVRFNSVIVLFISLK